MARVTKRAIRKKGAIRRTYERLETKLMAAVGRRTVRGGKKTAKTITRRAAKAALIAGSLAAAKVVIDEVRERRKRRQA